MKYLIYARKSSEAEDRQVQSIESQIKNISYLGKKLTLKILDTITESKSAKRPGREGFNSLLERIVSGEADGILVWHPDRLSRNPEDSARIISLFDSGKLSEVITPTQTFRNNPMDKFMLGFLMLNAKLENDNKSVNVKRGMLTKAENGWLPGAAKPGYMNTKMDIKGKEYQIVDPLRFPLIRRCWDMILTGFYSPPAILDKLNNEWGYRTPQKRKIGGKPMSRSMIYDIFSDSFYYGEYEYPSGSEKYYQGKHKPMISKEEFDKVQILLGRKSAKRPSKKEFPYTGLISCGGCGGAITCEEKWQIICPICKYKFSSVKKKACPKCLLEISEMVNPKILHYIYYHFARSKNPDCTQKSVTIDILENQIDRLLESIGISDAFKEWALKYLNELNDKEVSDRNTSLNSLQAAYSDSVKRLDNLLKLYISPQNSDRSLISESEFRSQKEVIVQEKQKIENSMNHIGKRIED